MNIQTLKFEKVFLIAVVSSLLLGACNTESPVSPASPLVSKTLVFDRARIDTTIIADTPGMSIQLMNKLMPKDTNPEIIYKWEVVSSTSNPSWEHSVCDPNSCTGPGMTEGEFKFTHGFPGLFYVDWYNHDTSATEMTNALCSLTVRIFPKNGSDTTWYTTVAHFVQ